MLGAALAAIAGIMVACNYSVAHFYMGFIPGLKVNADKSTFCALEIEYLGYILSKNGIKPQSNKVQAILAIHPPTEVKQLRHFLGMVQYYRDMWAKRSEMLAPLSDLVGECGETKTTRKNKVKKQPWHWNLIH